MQILSYDETAKRAGFVRRSLERLIAKGEGPAVVYILPTTKNGRMTWAWTPAQ
jgi:hypothetical protein